MVPLETVRGVYEKLSREAVEAQSKRPLPGQRIQHELCVDKNGYQDNAGDVERDSRDVMLTPKSTDDDVIAGKKNVIQRTAAGKPEGQQNGRATSAPTTPLHRPLASTDHDVTDDEMPQRGLTQALVAQWRELEERARADLVSGMRAGTSRSRSLSGVALQRGESPSPSRRAEQSRSDEDAETSEDIYLIDDDLGEQGRSGLQRQRTLAVEERRDVQDGDEGQLPPPLMTQYMLAKFRDMEAETQIIAGLQAKDKKAFKWEVKQVTPLVRGLTGAAYGDVPPASRYEAPSTVRDTEAGGETAEPPITTSTTSETTTAAAEDELPEPGTTRNLLAKFQCLQTTNQ